MATEASQKPQYITATDLFEHWMCPHWQYFDVYADPAKKKPRSKFAEMLLDAGVLNEREIIGKLQLQPVPGKTFEERVAATIKLMHEGVDMIYQGVLMSEDLLGIPDILEKRLGRSSNFGAYYYVPIDIKSAERLSDGHKFQLSLYAELLADVQGIRPHEAFMMNAYGVTAGFNLEDFRPKLLTAIEEVRSARNGKPLPPFVSSGCKQSPWFDECVALAEKTQDIALLYNVRESTMNKLREHGYDSYTKIAGVSAADIAQQTDVTIRTIERLKLQAEALVTKKHFFRHKCIFPEPATKCEIFFDIEGDPLRQIEYLFGFLVRDANGERYIKFVADRPADPENLEQLAQTEEKMWREFLEWTTTLPNDYAVYHYGNYEQVRLAILTKKYGAATGKADIFSMRMIDLAEQVKENVVFPLYFYSIKDIGNYIGTPRSKKIKSGGDSIGYYEDWLTKGDEEKLQAVIDYNEDDVIATRALKDWLAKGE